MQRCTRLLRSGFRFQVAQYYYYWFRPFPSNAFSFLSFIFRHNAGVIGNQTDFSSSLDMRQN